ncbi:MAG: hypothetical protein AAAC48_08175, partial [Phyllobacterium sp.]|uniref:hypothetical protein n=1 Tax=Phyllobacterium sp. TaxID=1871046 RepID=UPI0030F2774D
VDQVAIIFEGNDFAIDDVAFLASEFQALECTPMPVNIRQVTGDEKANLLASPAHHPHQHAIARRLTQSFSVFLS